MRSYIIIQYLSSGDSLDNAQGSVYFSGREATSQENNEVGDLPMCLIWVAWEPLLHASVDPLLRLETLPQPNVRAGGPSLVLHSAVGKRV